MSDDILLIYSDSHGIPSPIYIGHFHFVRLSSYETKHPVNQMHDGGRYPDADCAIGCSESLLLDLSLPVPAGWQLEQEAGTNPNNGTLMTGLVAELGQNAVVARILAGQPRPRRNWVMNPAWGGVISPALSDPYLDAFTGDLITIVTAQPTGTTTTTGGTPEQRAPDDTGDADVEQKVIHSDGSVSTFTLDESTGIIRHEIEGPDHTDLGPPENVPGRYKAIVSTFINAQSGRLTVHALAVAADGSSVEYGTEKAGASWTSPVPLASGAPPPQ